MKPLSIAYVHFDSDRYNHSGNGKQTGMFSYEVPELEWAHYPVGRHFQLDLTGIARRHDVVFQDDHKCYGSFVNAQAIPVLYYVVDSTLSEEHHQMRRQVAGRNADLILVDHDRLERFAHLGKPVRRLSYCVNERFYAGTGEPRMTDVCYHCRSTGHAQRQKLEQWLAEFCKRRGYRCTVGKREPVLYAQSFNTSKIAVSLARTPVNRPHRVFDVMAAGACLVTSRLPSVSSEERTAGVHYVEFSDFDGLGRAVDRLLESGDWEQIAEAGHTLVMERHTWAVRARELREMVADVFGI